MEYFHHKFILRSKNTPPCKVNINFYEEKYWMITLCDDNKTLHDDEKDKYENSC